MVRPPECSPAFPRMSAPPARHLAEVSLSPNTRRAYVGGPAPSANLQAYRDKSRYALKITSTRPPG